MAYDKQLFTWLTTHEVPRKVALALADEDGPIVQMREELAEAQGEIADLQSRVEALEP